MHRQRKPRLQAYVNQPEVPIHEVVVEDEALAAGGLDERRPLAPAQGKGAAGFDRGEDADQPLLDPIPLGQLAGEILLARPFPEILIRVGPRAPPAGGRGP
jgi:hypothetical protein